MRLIFGTPQKTIPSEFWSVKESVKDTVAKDSYMSYLLPIMEFKLEGLKSEAFAVNKVKFAFPVSTKKGYNAVKGTLVGHADLTTCGSGSKSRGNSQR